MGEVLGLATHCQVLPSQTITNDAAPESLSYWPTAVQNDVDTHDTDFKIFEPLPLLEPVICVHDAPSQSIATI